MKNKVKKRIFYFDEIRALAILCVILCHTTSIYRPFSYYSLKVAVPGVLNLLGYVGVPLFFMISGALLLNRDYELPSFFKKRFTRILYPFIFWMIITLAIHYLFLGAHGSQLYKIFVGSKRYTWFIWVLMGIYLFLPVINSFIKEYGMKGVKYFLAIWMITIILNTFGKYPFYRLDLTYFAQFIGYVVLGYYLRYADFRLSDKKIIILSIVLFIASSLINLYTIIKGWAVSPYICLFTVISGICPFLFFKSVSSYSESNPDSLIGKVHNKIENGAVGKLVLSISLCSYGMYFVNSLIFAVYKTLDIHSLKMIPILFIGVTLASWLIVLMISKVPFLNKFSGAS